METLPSASVIDNLDNAIMPDDIAVPAAVTPPTSPLHGNSAWPTHSGVTEQEAHDQCLAVITESPVYDHCEQYSQDWLESIIQSCVDDVSVCLLNSESLGGCGYILIL